MSGETQFYLVAIPAVILLGLSKGGFSGLSSLAMPMMSLVSSPVRAAAIVLPILIVQDWVSVWAFRRDYSLRNLIILTPSAVIGVTLGWLLAARVSEDVVRLAIGVIPMTLLAIIFFDFNFYSIGLPLIVFFCNLIFTSWSLGIFVSGLVLRNGLGAESIVWTLMFGVMPLACIYYPVSVLPHWLQYVAWALPPTYVFEGMRALLTDHVFRTDLMVEALAINVVLLIASFAIFLALLRSARRHGSLIQSGE